MRRLHAIIVAAVYCLGTAECLDGSGGLIDFTQDGR